MSTLYNAALQYPRALQTCHGLRQQGVAKAQREYFIRKAWELRKRAREGRADVNVSGMLLTRQAE